MGMINGHETDRQTDRQTDTIRQTDMDWLNI